MRCKHSKLKSYRHVYFSTFECKKKQLSFGFTIKLILLPQFIYGNETYIKIIN